MARILNYYIYSIRWLNERIDNSYGHSSEVYEAGNNRYMERGKLQTLVGGRRNQPRWIDCSILSISPASTREKQFSGVIVRIRFLCLVVSACYLSFTMETILGIACEDFTLLATDCSTTQSILVLKTGKLLHHNITCNTSFLVVYCNSFKACFIISHIVLLIVEIHCFFFILIN